MRGFIVLCVLAVASADQPGYNYQPVAHSDEGLSFQPGGHSGEAVLSQPIEAQPAQVAEEYEKEFYSFSAPDHEFEDGSSQNYGSQKKNIRVVFIKGPETHGLENAALQLAKGDEERTAIYVLQKQPDVSGLISQLQQSKQKPTRPEVHFVKYRTQQDAQNAQQAIRAQYDQLPGSSHNSNEGTAPVLNFASQGQHSHGGHSASAPAPAAPSSQYLPSNPVPQQSYLPPSLRRFVRL